MAGRMRSDDGSSFLNLRPRRLDDAVTQLLSLSDNTKLIDTVRTSAETASQFPTFPPFLDSPASLRHSHTVSHVAFACMMKVTMIGAIPSAALKWRLRPLGGPVQEPSGTAPTSTSPAVEEMRPGLLHAPAHIAT